MDGDEIEVTREELHTFIRKSVNSRELMSEDMKRKFNQLQSLFEQKKKLSTDLLKFTESVSKCEATVRELYAQLGWEYPDPEDDNCDDLGLNTEPAGYETDETDDSATYMIPVDSDEEPLKDTTESRSSSPEQMLNVIELKDLRVVLTRLPEEQRPCRWAAPIISREVMSDDEVSNVDSDYQPSGASDEPYSEPSSDSDFLPGSTKSPKQKKKKFCKTIKKVKTEETLFQVTPAQPGCSAYPIKSEPLEASAYVKVEVKAETKPFVVSDKKPEENLPTVLQVLNVGMKVLARRRKSFWERGEISEILEKDDGSKKFKVTFEDKGKVLVSGHHVAFDAMPKLVHLGVGTRVVSKYSSDNNFFSPGILGELPNRKNHMRFLIFFDDQKTLYVALPVIRLVSMQLANPLEDIRDEVQRHFMSEYLSRMPYPPHTQFRLGQKISVEREGDLETATVEDLDSALMLVTYANDGVKEWIYRGSQRLEHIMNMKDNI